MILEDLLRHLDIEEMYKGLVETLPQHRLEPVIADRINPMDTLGSLVDKLVTVNLKMWHNQEGLYTARRMPIEAFSKKYKDNIEEIHALIRRCCDLNVQRAALIDEIDRLFSDVVTGRKTAETKPQYKTY